MGTASRTFRRLRSALAAASVLAALLLASPGVEVVRADPAAGTADGPICQADAPPPGTPELALLVQEVMRRERERAGAGAAGPPPGIPVTLNGRGYNQGGVPDLSADLARAVSESR